MVTNQNRTSPHTRRATPPIVAVFLLVLVAGGCGTTSSSSTTQPTVATPPPAPNTASAAKPNAPTTTTTSTARTRTSTTTTTSTPKPSATPLSPNQILALGEQAVRAKTVSGPTLTAAVKLGTAQAQQLGQPSSQYVATAAYIGYMQQLQGFCTDSPDQLANVIVNAGDALRKKDPTVTYGQVMRALYQSAVGKPKHACAPELAAAVAATGAG
jgi:hypothetical protein